MNKLDMYQKQAARTMNSELTEEETLSHALYGIGSEAGEILAIYQKNLQGHIILPEQLMEELGDLLWFIAELCTVNEFKLSEVADYNIDKLMERYPNGFEPDKSKHRGRYTWGKD